MLVEQVPDGAAFDFIVVGAGSAGCAIANRLSADGRHAVLLMEAGPRDTDRNIHVPLMVANLLNDERITWPFVTEPQVHMHGQRQRWVRGRVLGGCSAINGSIYVRGDPREYDDWRDAGCDGWGYDDLLSYFRRLEDYPRGDPSVRGHGGPVGCTNIGPFDDLAQAFVDGAVQTGARRVDDYNDGRHYEGAFHLQYSTRRGWRSSAAVAYLRPARDRANLTVLTGGTATRVTLDGRRATGVQCMLAGTPRTFHARGEVILSAGPLQSPKLLELSGIGRPDVLQPLGIGVVLAAPQVGENLRDHPNLRVTYECTQPLTINDVLRSPWRKLREGLRFILQRKGFLTICSATAQANVRLDPASDRADLAIRLHPLSSRDRYARTPEAGLDPFSGFSLGMAVLQPRSTGTVHAQSTDPLQQARMDPRYLSHEADAQMFVESVKFARRLAATPAMAAMIVRETRPGPGVQDDAGLLDYVKASAQTSWHMVGTCRMGSDAAAVVDPQLRVRGIDALRVVDSSICPTIPASNTNIPAIMIGEKGADLVLAG
jgi:choline dehydrogenase